MKKIILLITAVIGATFLFAQTKIIAEEANKYVGQHVTVTGKIVGGKFMEKAKKPATVLRMAANGSIPVNIVIINEDRKRFPYEPEDYLNNKRVSVTGRLTESNGKPEIFINGPEDIKVEEMVGGEIKPLEFEGFNRYFQD